MILRCSYYSRVAFNGKSTWMCANVTLQTCANAMYFCVSHDRVPAFPQSCSGPETHTHTHLRIRALIAERNYVQPLTKMRARFLFVLFCFVSYALFKALQGSIRPIECVSNDTHTHTHHLCLCLALAADTQHTVVDASVLNCVTPKILLLNPR